jgi:hypothetical protein
MDESLKIIMVIGGTILVAVLVHYAIIKRVSKRTKRNASLISRTITAVKNPWSRENDQLEELSRLVQQVSSNSAEETEKER